MEIYAKSTFGAKKNNKTNIKETMHISDVLSKMNEKNQFNFKEWLSFVSQNILVKN